MKRIFSRVAISLAVCLGLLTAAVAGTVTYAYDAQGRLVSAAYSDGTMICYHYDAAGNRTQYTVVNGTCS